jgi:hypothetical protein
LKKVFSFIRIKFTIQCNFRFVNEWLVFREIAYRGAGKKKKAENHGKVNKQP